jgi:hypothetical protein
VKLVYTILPKKIMSKKKHKHGVTETQSNKKRSFSPCLAFKNKKTRGKMLKAFLLAK